MLETAEAVAPDIRNPPWSRWFEDPKVRATLRPMCAYAGSSANDRLHIEATVIAVIFSIATSAKQNIVDKPENAGMLRRLQ